MATGNGGVMTDMAMPAATSRSPKHQNIEKNQNHSPEEHEGKPAQKQKHQHPQTPVSRRPPRACTARTPSRLAPPAPSVERSTTRKPPRGTPSSESDPQPSNTSMILTSPPPPSENQRWLLRCMWELASILNFLNVFRPVLKLKADFTMEELESALMNPNSLLDDIHIVLLKAIHPISRSPLNRDTWVTILCKKLKDRWAWLAEGPFPLAPYHGDEKATYNEISPEVRVLILKALCEARLDQDDIRVYIDEVLKQGNPLSYLRKERTGIDLQGTTYWYENDPVAGQRLYRELKKPDVKEKSRVRGRSMPPPSSGTWETLATSLEEFETVAEKLSSSRNRLEIAIGKRLNNDIIPDLRELQKKKERALKKQQRQAVLLNSYFNTEGITTGRPKRERKPVTYTFDDYDKSISEAIKITKRRHSSPEPLGGADSKLSNGSSRQHSEDEMNPTQKEGEPMQKDANESKPIDTTRRAKSQTSATHSSESDLSADGHHTRGRHHRKPQRYAENDFVDALSESQSDYSAEDDIEGEAVYDENYVSKRNKKASEESSASDGEGDGDDEYKGEEEDEEEEEEDDEDGYDVDEDEDDDDDYVQSSDEGEYSRRGRNTRNSSRGRRKGRAEQRAGLRRSQRSTRKNVNYSKYEESDMDSEEDVEMDDTKTSEDSDSDKESEFANSPENDETAESQPALTVDDQQSDDKDVLMKTENNQEYGDETQMHRTANGLKDEPHDEVKPRNELRGFLDLNVAVGVPDDSPAPGFLKDESTSFFTSNLGNVGDERPNYISTKNLGSWPR